MGVEGQPEIAESPSRSVNETKGLLFLLFIIVLAQRKRHVCFLQKISYTTCTMSSICYIIGDGNNHLGAI